MKVGSRKFILLIRIFSDRRHDPGIRKNEKLWKKRGGGGEDYRGKKKEVYFIIKATRYRGAAYKGQRHVRILEKKEIV